MFYTRWRQIELPYADYKATTSAVTSLDGLIAEMAERARGLAALHTYQIVISRIP
jgi:hypothetical protein